MEPGLYCIQSVLSARRVVHGCS